MIALLVLQHRDDMNSALSLHTFDISDDDERLGQLCLYMESATRGEKKSRRCVIMAEK